MKSLFAHCVVALAVIAIPLNAIAKTAATDATLEQLGQSYVEAINKYDADSIIKMMSGVDFAESIAEVAGENDLEKQQYRTGFKNAVPNVIQRLVGELQRQEARAVYLRIHTLNDLRGPLVRYRVGDGYNYVLLVPVSDADGVKIGDMYVSSTGERLSQTMGTAARLASSPSESFLGQLFGSHEVNEEFVTQIQTVSRLRQQGQVQDAYAILDNLPSPLRNHRLILLQSVQLAAQFDEALYRTELRRLAKHHGDDPRVGFMLLDHYFYENDTEAALQTVDIMEQFYGSDGVFFIFRASLELIRNRPEVAAAHGRSAVELEPNNEDAHWALVTALIEAKQYQEGVEALSVLERNFDYAFVLEDFAGDSALGEFAASKAFTDWIAQH